MMSGQLQRFVEPYNQFSEHDETKLSELVSKVDEGILCEIGCWTGHSTSIIANRAKEINTKIIVIDSFEGNKGTPLFEYAENNPIKAIFLKNMTELNFLNVLELFHMNSDSACSYVKDESLSFLFIDAGHTYEQVKNDLINYLPKIKSGAIVCGHDYEADTFDENHINEDYVGGKHHGVIKAVNEILGIVEHEGRMWWKRL